MLGGFVQFILTFVDTAFLGHIGELQLNAAGNAGLVYITFFLVAQGLSEGLQIITARRIGAGNHLALRNLFWNAFFLLIALALLAYILVAWFSSPLLTYVTADSELKVAIEGFLKIRSVGYFFAIAQLTLIGFYSGIAQTKILATSTTVMASVNLVFDYLLIHGIWLFPEMGLNGAALASVIAEACALLYCISYVRRDKRVMDWIGFTGFKLVKEEIKKLVQLSLPIMGQRFLAMISWTIFFFLIEKIGRHELAISQLIRSLYFLAFIPIMGFGTTTKTYVSNYMAQHKFELVPQAIKYLTKVSLVIIVLLIHGYLLYPQAIIGILTNDGTLIKDTAPVLQLVFFEALVFMAATVIFNAIAGVGDTRWAFIIENLCITIYIFTAYYITVVNPQPILIVWCMEFVYFGLLLIGSLLYFRFKNWRAIQI
ncbi:MATE family efflux transporter [Luteibaculum oceani]|uniref:Multidrug-efflux transporter n=1 Tax=Luteibaculum oceani TaxID=1294296 RepID=A0A5C6USL2_9FLAO|nr:MATE family efflux transporter [Luteibaculum oceani]TXC76237.1 MATE family efflux transporter [Luteibaculum oceani]